MKQEHDFSLRIQDYGTIAEESFSEVRSAGAFDFATLSFSVFGNTAMAAFLQLHISGIATGSHTNFEYVVYSQEDIG